jgi:hypothetical protein
MAGENLMKATTLYRVAGVLLLLVVAGNTYAFVNFWHVAGRMDPVRFPSGHSGFSYAQVVLGLGVFSTLCVLFGAYLAWHLGTLARTTPQAIGALGWVLFAYQLIGVYISLISLSGPVRLLFVVIAICIGWAAWLTTSTRSKLSLDQDAGGRNLEKARN